MYLDIKINGLYRYPMKNAPRIRLVLWKAAKAVEKADKASIEGTGLQLSEFAIMEVLLHKGPLPINTVGQKVLLTSGSMTAAVNRLERKGFVRRERDPADGRFFLVHLTDSGRRVIEAAYEKHERNLERIAEALTSEERDELVRLLKKIGIHAEKIVTGRDAINFETNKKEDPTMKVLILYYSMYGHIHKMAEAVAEGVGEVEGAEAVMRRVPETLPEEVLAKMGAVEAQKAISQVPVCSVDELASADAVIFGTPTRFGNMCGQMRQFLDATGQLWLEGSMVGKVGSVFASSNTQHGGQESTILSFHITLLHHGFVIVGLPYTFQGQMKMDEITGGSPYGASTIAGVSGERTPTENELAAARFQGRHVALIASKLAK